MEEIVDQIIEALENDPEVFRADEDADDTVRVELLDGSVYVVSIASGEEPRSEAYGQVRGLDQGRH